LEFIVKIHRYSRRPSEHVGSDALAELALDLRWSFNHAADKLWEQLDPELWDLTHNPWFVLQTISQEKLQSAIHDPQFRQLLNDLLREKRAAQKPPAWFQLAHPKSGLNQVAYFSMEYMLSEALPIYSGGLGNVAGDQLKTASNLGVPVIGIGLLYQQGYFRQEIDSEGRQQALYPFNDPGQLPIKPLREPNGEWLRFRIGFPGSDLWIRAWHVRVGRAHLYLLDTNDPANFPAQRTITGELYGGGSEMRLRQELVLGVGGWRLLQVLGLKPEVCHLNEGHSAFVVLERARCYMAKQKVPFRTALMITRAGNLFTTHTPVEAGFDQFSSDLMEKYFKKYAEDGLSIPFQELLALGRRDGNDSAEPFNMAYLAVRGSSAVNGVSRLHGEVSRRIFQVLFPRWPAAEIPVAHVTNGVHVPTWDSAEADRLWEAACGKERWRGTMAELEKDFRSVSDADLWRLRSHGGKALVAYVRKCRARQLAGQGASPSDLAEAEQILDPDVLTVGFARRFATYKRPNLLLHDPQRLIRILTNQERPVQLVLAGKAHPMDGDGQIMIQQWEQFIRFPEVRARAVFLCDYDVSMAEHLVQGIDVWINTPRRPWEACGTSGMKVLVNGGLNLSELDGWWAEAYSPEVGWAIGDGKEHGSDPSWDAAEAEALYRKLEQEVIPEFYARNKQGIPTRWVARMRESMARLTPTFSSNRMVRQYTEEYYLPAASAYRARAANKGQAGNDLADWQTELARHWSSLRFGSVSVNQRGNQITCQAQVYLGGLSPEAVRVELYAEGLNGDPPVRLPMDRGGKFADSGNGFLYSACLPPTRPANDYTPRIIPFRSGARVPLEAPYILWCDAPCRNPA
jgi:starch phosphorylase